jgi:hypothetical protein
MASFKFAIPLLALAEAAYALEPMAGRGAALLAKTRPSGPCCVSARHVGSGPTVDSVREDPGGLAAFSSIDSISALSSGATDRVEACLFDLLNAKIVWFPILAKSLNVEDPSGLTAFPSYG